MLDLPKLRCLATASLSSWLAHQVLHREARGGHDLPAYRVYSW